MLTLHQLSAAYVLASQRPEQEKKPHSPTYEPACVSTWAQQVAAADDQLNYSEQVK
jgi:hypothetical protein